MPQSPENLTLVSALVIAVVWLGKAYLDKVKQVETLLEAVTRTLALTEKALERNEKAIAELEFDKS